MNITRCILGFTFFFATTVLAAEYKTEVFIPGYGFHAIHGIAADADGMLYVGSVVGQSIYKVDPKTGESSVWAKAPLGMADDIEIGPDGQFYWTSFMLGKVHTRLKDGTVKELATDLPGMNSIALKQDGRLFATQVFSADALHEIDPTGEKPARKIMEDMGGLNGFDFGPDGRLYGPIWFKGQVAAVDVDTAKLTVIAEGFEVPAAVNFNSKGELFAVDSARGEVIQIDIETGAKTLIAKTKTGIDNLCFDAEDNLYITIMSESAIHEVNVEDGTTRTVKEGSFAFPADIAIDGNTLYLADTFSNRTVDLTTKESVSIARFPEHAHEYSNGIAISDKFIHSASFFNSAVQTLDRKTGEILTTYHELITPFDVAEMPDGRLLALQMMSGSIVELKSETERETVFGGLTTPVAMVVVDANQLYVTEYASGNVSLINLDTGAKTIIATELEGPEGIALGPDGLLYVAETAAQRVTVIYPRTGGKTVIAENLPIGYKTAPGMPPMGITTGVAVADNGDVYVTSDIEDALYRIRKVK